MGADVGDQLKIPNPPIELSHVIKIHLDMSVMGNIDPQSIQSHCSMSGIRLNGCEYESLIDIERARKMIGNGMKPDDVMGVIFNG